LLACNGEISRQSIRQFLEPYLDRPAKTYNNIVDGLKAFVLRYLQKPELINGFKHTHVPDNFDRQVPSKEQLRLGFESLNDDKEKAIFLFFASSGLRRGELLNLTKEDVDSETRCVKAKHR
jgi:integrase